MRTSASLSKYNRSGGILLHPTSLPGNFGIGELGPQALEWVDFLKQSGCGLWQILPLGPTGYGDSPYQCFSSFAGNPNLISVELLYQEHLLDQSDLQTMPQFSTRRVDYGELIPWKAHLLGRAYANFCQRKLPDLRLEFEEFCASHADWLDDFALFMALKQAHDGRVWMEWDEPYRKRLPQALGEFATQNRALIDAVRFQQFLFFRQWAAVRSAANRSGIRIIGDVPIFVAQDSCDVWCEPHLFKLDSRGYPRVVAGVPPDYFSPTGQRWGNPIYDWKAHSHSNFIWWKRRIKHTLSLVDLVRIDHFRGFCAYWEIPARSPTAEVGRWVKSPGKRLFSQLSAELGGELPFIAEDLGVITSDVIDLRDKFGLPGMKVLQFAFDDHNPRNPFLPHNFVPNCVVYTGTHDNDTTFGWYQSLPEEVRVTVRRYLPLVDQDPAWQMIQYAWASVATFAVAPLQDFLRLGSEARMNHPGKVGSYWGWRVSQEALNGELCDRIRELNERYNRQPHFGE
ncbi:MAG: 4-alpha-glucanotransferase [Anaerolineales bacterium]|nr:4-alpha-glucanotransferase [Anaerolineales bacterium]MDW8161123.1 4-alpha-glucanotransferase [Anaerolineales bacterium]